MSDPVLSPFAEAIFKRTYARTPGETWPECATRVARAVAEDQPQQEKFERLIRDRVFVPGGRYLYTAGRKIFQNANCFGFVAGDSREAWADLVHDAMLCLSMGGGIGVEYSDVRESGRPIVRLGGVSSGPIALMQMVNEVARHVMQGGSRRSAIWAGLSWRHPDVGRFVEAKDWDADVMAMKAKRFEAPATLDMTNISVVVDDEYFAKLGAGDPKVVALHRRVCEHAVRTGEPAFRNQSLIQLDDPDAVTGNPCQEAVLHDHDSCNLGSIVLPRVRDLDHLEEVTRLAVRFLYQGSLRGDSPTPRIAATTARNRRIGLGFMGIHEHMARHGSGRYEWSQYLEQVFSTWAQVSEDESHRVARDHGGPVPVTTRAIAPTGTISIIAETTSGIEPIHCAAYKRRYITTGGTKFQYVVDPTARRLIELGVPADRVEDAFSLAGDVERRLTVQSEVQRHVDQAISSTVNLPAGGVADLSDVVARYLPRLKGVTFYPDGARPGQPITPAPMELAMREAGVVYEEEGSCAGGVCGV